MLPRITFINRDLHLMKPPAYLSLGARSALSLMISAALLTGTAAHAQNFDESECVSSSDDQDRCEEQKNASGDSKKSGKSGRTLLWALGGIAVAGAAAAGGGGSDSSGPGNGNPGGGGGGGNPVGEGGSYGNNTSLTRNGEQTVWSGNAHSVIIGDNVRNDGQLAVQAGTLTIRGDGDLRNNGSLSTAAGTRLSIEGEGELDNYGTLSVGGQFNLSGDGSLDNYGTFAADGATIQVTGESDIENQGTMRLTNSLISLSGDSEFDNSATRTTRGQLTADDSRFVLRDMAAFDNFGDIEAINLATGDTLIDIQTARIVGENDPVIESFDNYGTIRMNSDARILSLAADRDASVGVNRTSGHIFSRARGQTAIHVEGAQATFVNQGTLTVTGDNAVAMNGVRGATLINDGIINLGTSGGANGTGLVAMRSDGSAVLNNRVGGVINIHADQSHAFQVSGSGSGRIINNGQVNVYGNGSGIFADGTSAGAERPGADLPYAPPRPDDTRGIAGYTVGTNADGSAGQMTLTGGGRIVDVDVDTGFTRGTAAQRVKLDDVFMGAVSGEEQIRSKTVVWEATAERNADGNVDVTMTKRNYADLVGDKLTGFANALDDRYTNSDLFRSLELESAGALQSAMAQLSGQGLAAGASRVAGLSQAFWTALDAQRSETGLSLLGYAPGVRQGWGPAGQGHAMSLVTPGRHGQMDMQFGVMHDTHAGHAVAAGDSMRSNFFGMGWSQQLGGFQLRHAVNNEWHALETTRSLNYGNVRQSARSRRDISRYLVGSTLARTWALGGLQLHSRLGAQAYAQHESAFNEWGAGEFNLQLGAMRANGINMETGLGWQWPLSARWHFSGDASLVKPLAYDGGARTAQLGGANDAQFQWAGLQPNGLDHRLSLGLDYRHRAVRMNLGVQAQRFFGQRDDRTDLSLAYAF